MKVTVAPLDTPLEQAAYTLARYSRSSDSYEESLKWVKEKANEGSFLDTYYFQYGHASIADLAHITLSFEGVSEVAAIEIEDEELWDGQAQSTRYQDFSKKDPVVPPCLHQSHADALVSNYKMLIGMYEKVRDSVLAVLKEKHPFKGNGPMKASEHNRILEARAFDSARYCLPLCIPTNVGQVVSLRTLEKQMTRWLSDGGPELHRLATTTVDALRSSAPMFARRLSEYEPPSNHSQFDYRLKCNLRSELLPCGEEYIVDELLKDDRAPGSSASFVDLCPNHQAPSTIAAMALYRSARCGFRTLTERLTQIPNRALHMAIACSVDGGELPRPFRGGKYIFDIRTDLGAYRDLHRHRRCTQIRQRYLADSWAWPKYLDDPAIRSLYSGCMANAAAEFEKMPAIAKPYCLPMAMRIRSLFVTDLAEAQYIIRLRSGVKGHYSYRQTAYDMYKELIKVEPWLVEFLKVTHPSVEDEMKR